MENTHTISISKPCFGGSLPAGSLLQNLPYKKTRGKKCRDVGAGWLIGSFDDRSYWGQRDYPGWVWPGPMDEKYPPVPLLLMGNTACLIGILITHNGSWNNPYKDPIFFWGGVMNQGVRMIFFWLFYLPSCFGRWVWMVFCCTGFHEPKHERWGTKHVSLWGFHLQNRCNDLYLVDSCGIYLPNKRGRP